MAVNKCYQNSSEHDLLAKQWLSYTPVVGDISHGHFQNRFILWLFDSADFSEKFVSWPRQCSFVM